MKRWLTRVLPHPRTVHEHRSLAMFGSLLKDPNLWHLNRRSVSGAVAVGMFLVFLPIFGQMVIAAAASIKLRVNLPIAFALTWISNPLTFAPIFYFCFMVGCWLLGHPIPPFDRAFWFDWHNWLGVFGELLLGCLICSTVSAVLGYYGVHVLWRWNLRRQIARRQAGQARARLASVAGRGPGAEPDVGVDGGDRSGAAVESGNSRPSSSRQT